MKLSGNPLILFSMRFPAIVLCLLIAAPSAHSYNRLDAIKSLQTVVPNWESVEVTFWINDLRESDDPVVKLGQSVHLNMQAGAPAHYLVVLIDAKGETTIFAGDADSAATRRLQIPNDGSSVGFEQGAPVGDQNIFVFASNSAFMMPDLGLNSDERIVTLPRTIAALDDFSTMLNRHASLNMLAMAPRYQYFVFDPNDKLAVAVNDFLGDVMPNTRGLRPSRRTGGVMVEPEEPLPQKPPANTTKPVPADPVPGPPKVPQQELSLDIKFQYNSADLGPEGVAQLDSLGDILLSLLEAENLPKISLEGHTDDIGSAEYNLDLSDKRAKSARRYLLGTFGLPATSIEAYGMGESNPMVANVDKNARALNRRVELRVLP